MLRSNEVKFVPLTWGNVALFSAALTPSHANLQYPDE